VAKRATHDADISSIAISSIAISNTATSSREAGSI
jgi:hypothetical protein